MRGDDEVRVWMVAGAAGSLVLGIALIPLRTLTAASNLAFVFLAFTIIVAELGGRGAALLTALVSAMSLNFFLTEPYLTLRSPRRTTSLPSSRWPRADSLPRPSASGESAGRRPLIVRARS